MVCFEYERFRCTLVTPLSSPPWGLDTSTLLQGGGILLRFRHPRSLYQRKNDFEANGQAGVNWDLFGEHPHPRPERLQVLTLSHWTNSIGVKTTFYLIQILLGVKCAWFLLQLLFCQLQVYFSWSQCSSLMALDSISENVHCWAQ